MDIDRGLDGADLLRRQLAVDHRGKYVVKSFLRERGPLVTTTRIGITRAAARPLRFYLERSLFVSRRKARRNHRFRPLKLKIFTAAAWQICPSRL